MSMDKCHTCGHLVDTDADPDCYQPYPSYPLKGAPDICVCKSCRDRQEYDSDRAASIPANWQPSAEQQAIIDRAEAEDDEGDAP